jgi:iron complex outermembrane receptor protein
MGIGATSVSRRREKLRDAPSAIAVITGEAILGYGASSLREALRLAGNLELAQE